MNNIGKQLGIPMNRGFLEYIIVYIKTQQRKPISVYLLVKYYMTQDLTQEK